jgi:triosephosphate isomerase (TIM)
MKKIFAANWKLHKTPKQTREFFKQFISEAQQTQNEIVFFPPASSWEATAESLKGSGFKWGSQNTYFEAQGAFTGENSAMVMHDLGGTYALIGHSERRKIFGEKVEVINKKVQQAISLNLAPMLCIGETLHERESHQTDMVNEFQLKSALRGVTPNAPLVVAYEPVWAIGTGKVATPEQAQEAHQFVKTILKSLGFPEAPVLYGGSVKPENARELLSRPGIDGFLVGGASLEVKSFLDICLA